MVADDYLPKTFSTRELLARLRAVTRRHNKTKQPTIAANDLPLLIAGGFIHQSGLANSPLKKWKYCHGERLPNLRFYSNNQHIHQKPPSKLRRDNIQLLFFVYITYRRHDPVFYQVDGEMKFIQRETGIIPLNVAEYCIPAPAPAPAAAALNYTDY